MSVTVSQLPHATTQRLQDLRRQVRMFKLAEGLLAGLFGLVMSYVTVFALDRVIDTPAILRVAILLAGSVGIGVFLPMICHRWIWGTRQMEQMARIVRRKYPSLGDSLLGVIELARDPESVQASSALAQAAIAQVDKDMQKRDLAPAIPRALYRQWAVAAAFPLSVAAVALTFVPAAGWNAAERWLFPWKNVERYTFAQIEQLPKKIIVPHGENFDLGASLSEKTEWSPERGTVRVNTLKESITSNRDGKNYDFEIPARTEDSKLHVSIGDVRKTVEVVPTTRPEVVTLRANVALPAYLQRPEPQVSDVRGGAISIVKGANANFEAQVNRDLAKANVNGEAANIKGTNVVIPNVAINDSKLLNINWTDVLGLSSKNDFKLKVQAIDDEAAIITCQQENPQPVVLTSDVIKMALSAKDDFGVAKIGLEWSTIPEDGAEGQVIGSKYVSAGGPTQTEVASTATFSANSDNVQPQRIQLRAFAEDYLPNRPRSYSPAYIVHIMTPDEHAMWLTDQLRRWIAQADDVYEQEVRLHNVNRSFRDMDDETLALPATQRQLEQQIAAERANAGRLGLVTKQGDQLLAQALRNPEIAVEHVETMAQVLRDLNHISQEGMPSIAGLLKSSSQMAAPGASGSGNGTLTAGNNRGGTGGGGGMKVLPTKHTNAPTLTDIESGFNKSNGGGGKKGEKRASPSALGPAQTVLMGGAPKQKNQADDNSKAPDDINAAIDDQSELVAEFAKLRDQMQALLDDMENTTFVKRLKAASRKQMEIATDLNRTIDTGFGQKDRALGESQSKVLSLISEREDKQSSFIGAVQADLEAYAARKKDRKFGRIADEMREFQVGKELKNIGTQITRNFTGEATVNAEYWADTFDRWAEEMVVPSSCNCKCNGKSASLPPWVVLEILRLIDAETDLRDETRSLEESHYVITEQDYIKRLKGQTKTQNELSTRTRRLIDDIKKLPEGESKFFKTIGMLTQATTVMDEVVDFFEEPNTGPPAIAAESEVIEILLATKRANPNSGGAPGDSAGGGSSGTTDQAALTLHGDGNNANAKADEREVQQSSGGQAPSLPEEFRTGLDAFFNAIDKK